MSMMNLKHSLERFVKGVSYLMIIRILKAIVSICIVAILTRSMSKVDIGVYFIMLQIGNIASIFCRMGVDQGNQKFISMALIQSPSAIPDIMKKLRMLPVLSTLVMLVLMSLFWRRISNNVFSSELLTGLLMYQLVMIVVMTFEQIQSSTLRAMDQLFQSAVSETFIRQSLLLIVLGWLFITDASSIQLERVLFIWGIVGLCSIFIFMFTIRWSTGPYRALKGRKDTNIGLREIVKTSIPMGLASAATTVRGSSDLIIIGWLLGPAAAGLYGPLKRVSQQFLFFLPVHKMLSPLVASLFAQKNLTEVEALCRKGTTYASLFCLPLALFFFVWGDWFLHVAFGKKYANLGLLLTILVLGPLCRVFLGAAGIVLQMTGRQLLTMKVNIFITILAIVSMAVVALPYKLYGVATVSSAMLILQVLILNYLVYKEMGIRTYSYLLSFKFF